MPSPKTEPQKPAQALPVVVLGTDTWASVGARHDVDPDDLLAANGGPRPLIAGEELSLP